MILQNFLSHRKIFHGLFKPGAMDGLTLLLLLFFSPALLSASYVLEPGQTVVGELKFLKANRNDTFLKLAGRFDLGYEELIAANPGIDPWLPAEGSRIVLPLRFILPEKRDKVVHVNLSEYRIYYFPDENRVMTFPISIGRGEWQTPVGAVEIADKIINPNWYPTEAIRREHELAGDPLPRMVPPGDDNPLGRYALKLSLPGYFIHGTNRPYGIGMKVTHGCIRLRPDDILDLFADVDRRTRVNIYSQPFKVAVQERAVYFEANNEAKLSREDYTKALTTAVKSAITKAEQKNNLIDWRQLADLINERTGIARRITLVEGPEPLPAEIRRTLVKPDHTADVVTPTYLF